MTIRRSDGPTVRRPLFAAILVLAGITACATVRQFAALKQVAFAIDRVQGIRLAGVSLDGVRRPSDISAFDAARIGTAILRRQLPLEFDIHVAGNNPADNPTTARLVRLQWTLDLNGRETVSGTLDTTYSFPPGVETDVRVPIRLDLAQFFQNSAADAIDLALGLAGLGTRQTEVVLRAVPTIDTPLGPISYPNPITIVRRTVGP
ncbi:MAG: hypothetical protein Q7J79_09800 [Gemmatimonadales bacterium]|nr:hypothetical protein [Gemmatimonadales bacterium]